MGASRGEARIGATRATQSGGSLSTLHLLGYLLLLATGFQAGRMACTWGELGDDGGGSPAAQRAIVSRISRLERLAEQAARASPAARRDESPAEADARRLRTLAAAPAGASGGPRGRCVDKLAKCAQWAAAGECKLNAGYMRETCAKSCGACAVASGGAGAAAASADSAGGGGGAELGADGCPADRRPFHGARPRGRTLAAAPRPLTRGFAFPISRACVCPY